MKERNELKKLVFIIVSNKQEPPTAKEIYNQIRKDKPSITHTEKVSGFKSFVKILNSFDIIDPIEKKGQPFLYKVKE